MKNLKYYALLVFLIIICQAKAYEWHQVTEAGIDKHHAEVKKVKLLKEADFIDLEISKKRLSVGEVASTFPKLNSLKKIVMIGDTGCRIKESKTGGEYQDCNDPESWPFEKIVEQAAKENPDLTIHLGDYHYREKCSPGAPCEKMSPVNGYGWSPWELDFFKPMAKLFEKAPLVIVRGNHEDCNRAFHGYKLLMANTDWEKDCIDYEPAQLMIFGDLAIINFDSSSISEMPLFEQANLWTKRLDEINEKIEKLKIKYVWMVTHKPIYGIISYKSALFPGNINFRTFFEKSLLKNKVSTIFSGHIHTSMLVASEKYGKQVVLGNSGTKLDKIQDKISPTLLHSFSYKSAELTNSGFGYAVLEKKTDRSWTLSFKSAEGKETLKTTIDY